MVVVVVAIVVVAVVVAAAAAAVAVVVVVVLATLRSENGGFARRQAEVYETKILLPAGRRRNFPAVAALSATTRKQVCRCVWNVSKVLPF